MVRRGVAQDDRIHGRIGGCWAQVRVVPQKECSGIGEEGGGNGHAGDPFLKAIRGILLSDPSRVGRGNPGAQGSVQTRTAMIVPSHSPEEVVREALRDMPALWNKMQAPIARLQRQMRVDKSLRLVPQLFEYRSPGGNNWLVAMLPAKKVLTIVPFVWYRGTDGYYRAARIVQDGVCYHISHHVLEQYAERFNRTGDGLARLKEFIRENMCFGTEHLVGHDDVRVGITHGFIIGKWVVPHQVAQLITFVDHGKLFPDQLEQMERLDQQRFESTRPLRIPGYNVKPWDLPRPSV